MIVDDSIIVRQVLIKTLGMIDVDVNKIFEAGNGREGLDVMKSNWVDVIFLDINMPEMNGVEFMEKLREEDEFRQTPVIVISTEGSRERKAQLADKDIKAYLRKPVTPEELASTISNVMGEQENGNF